MAEAGFDRARNAAGYDDALDTDDLAALLFKGVAMRHPLMDGNKRLALMGMVVFLDLNGVVFDAPEVALYHKLIAVLTREATAADLAAFVREHSVTLPP